MADKKNKSLKPADDKVLQSIMAEIEQLAKEVVGDYKKTPSEMSGSITQVHESSPFLATREERLIKQKK
jgi:hypothetical protein